MITGSCMAITAESRSARMSHITLDKKHTGKPSAGNLHAGFDEAGTGNRLYDSASEALPEETGSNR
jgi:hypothetical protein